MRIRMKIRIGGAVSGGSTTYHDLKRGDIIDVDEPIAHQYSENGYAETNLTGDIGQAYKPEAAPHY